MPKDDGWQRYDRDIKILDELGIVYDPSQKEYYNNRIDIFLTEDDISFHKLRPYDKITSPLPSPLPSDYFTNWSN